MKSNSIAISRNTGVQDNISDENVPSEIFYKNKHCSNNIVIFHIYYYEM